MNLIIDTSCALQELDRRFRFQKPNARTGLEETEACGLVRIVTADKDILESNASAFTPDVIHDPLRTYARSKVVTLMMGTQTMGGVLVSGEAIKGLVDQVRRRPWLPLLGVGLVGALAYWDKKQMEQKGTSTLREAWRLGVTVTRAAFERVTEDAGWITASLPENGR